MTKRNRYLLILAGFIIFIFLAPLIIIYVAGVKYDLSNRRFVRTGILSAQVDPKGVNIYLNGVLRRSSSGSIRFLLPGEYQVAIKKVGYQDWSKRLSIKADEVTWVNPIPQKLPLFFSQPSTQTLAEDVLDVQFLGRHLYYLTPERLTIKDLLPFGATKSFILPKAVNHITISPDGKLLALTGTASSSPVLLIFDTSKEKISDFSVDVGPHFQTQFDFANNLLLLEGQNLSELDSATGAKTPLFSNVKTFVAENNGLYLVQASATTTVPSLEFFDPVSKTIQILFSPLPRATALTVLVSPNKQVFINADGWLYKVNSNLEKLGDNVQSLNWDQSLEGLLFIHAGELSYYNFNQQETHFLTRTSSSLLNPVFSPTLGFSFVFKGTQLNAIELDSRDHQNEYTLYQAQTPQKFYLSPEENILYVLDGSRLISLKIR